MIGEISSNIKVHYQYVAKEQDENFNSKLDFACENYNSKLLQYLFIYKWYPVENNKVIKELQEFLFREEIKKQEKPEKFPQKRKKIFDFTMPLLWFYHNTKDKITKPFYKFLFDNIMLYDNDVLFGNLEMFLVCNAEDEFIENLKIFQETQMSLTQSSRSVFQEEDSTISQLEGLFPGFLHYFKTQERRIFVDLVRNRNNDIINILFADVEENQEYDDEKYQSIMTIISKFIEDNPLKMTKVSHKEPSNWLEDLRKTLEQSLAKGELKGLNLKELNQKLEENELKDDLVLKGIQEVWTFDNNQGEFNENIAIFN